jgi:hypothetical protein
MDRFDARHEPRNCSRSTITVLRRVREPAIRAAYERYSYRFGDAPCRRFARIEHMKSDKSVTEADARL